MRGTFFNKKQYLREVDAQFNARIEKELLEQRKDFESTLIEEGYSKEDVSDQKLEKYK